MRFILLFGVVSVALGSVIEIPSNFELPTFDFNEFEEIGGDHGQKAYQELLRTLPYAASEDADLKFPELVQKYGYPVESHYVTTSDGYILNLHRIPYGKKGPSENRPVVFLMHGILCSSVDWIIPGPEKGLGYMLADKGYDVWLGNARGTRYSRNHTTLDPDNNKKQFWDFSWHEIGTTDLPAMIDFALEHSKQEKLFYVAHSQGTTAFYVMCSLLPEYNDKIRAQISLAPIAYMNHMTGLLMRFIAIAEGGLSVLLKLIGMYEFLPTDGFLHNILQGFCGEGPLQILCSNSLFVLCGFNPKQMNTTLLPIMMGHTPAGASSKQLLHYAQSINSGKFRQYDYGLLGNMNRYHSIWPPAYKLKNVKCPVYLLYSHNDWLSAKTDVYKLYDELGDANKFLISDNNFNHMDYLFAIDVDKLVNAMVISLMTRH